ncbi:MAG: DNA-directed RNA polymerase subunit delta [Firmicutes bacterium]|nr:DNA-directed RNA polymerase subunit delta [Bacillota bacterium]
MNINKMKKSELELLSFTDIAYEILKTEKQSKSTVEIFRTISELLELSEDEFTSKIADFYTSLTTDKRFIALETGNWDLKERHSTKMVIDDDDDIDIEVEDTTDEEPEEEDITTEYDENEDYADDDLEDLVVIDTDENEEE